MTLSGVPCHPSTSCQYPWLSCHWTTVHRSCQENVLHTFTWTCSAIHAPWTASRWDWDAGVNVGGGGGGGGSKAGGAAWASNGSNFDDYEFGVTAITAAGEIRITEFRLDVIYREDVTLDTLLTDDKCETFQWLEIEGIRWIPTDKPLMADDWTAGSYYYGLEHRPVAGVLASNEKFRSGRINHTKGNLNAILGLAL